MTVDDHGWGPGNAGAKPHPGWWVRVGQDRRGVTLRVTLASAAVLALTVGMLPLRDQLGILNVMLLFLILSLLAGLLLGVRAAAIGAVLAFLAYDFFFIPPYNTLTVADTDHVLGLFVYLGVAIGSAILMARLRTQTDAAIRDNRRTTLLYDLNRSLVGDVTLDNLLRTIADRVVQIYGSAGCRILIADGGRRPPGRRLLAAGRLATLDRQAGAMARYAIDQRQPAGVGAPVRRIRRPHGTVQFAGPAPVRGRDALYVPITASGRVGRAGGDGPARRRPLHEGRTSAC